MRTPTQCVGTRKQPDQQVLCWLKFRMKKSSLAQALHHLLRLQHGFVIIPGNGDPARRRHRVRQHLHCSWLLLVSQLSAQLCQHGRKRGRRMRCGIHEAAAGASARARIELPGNNVVVLFCVATRPKRLWPRWHGIGMGQQRAGADTHWNMLGSMRGAAHALARRRGLHTDQRTAAVCQGVRACKRSRRLPAASHT